MQATIKLEYDDLKTATAIADALSPDNFTTPPGLTVKTQLNGNTVTTDISIEGKFTTFISTIDDLLESASTAEKTLYTIKRR